MVVIASPVYFYGLSAELKAIIDRLHTPMRNEFKIKKLALILVGAATLPELFDSIIMQYKLVLNSFHLECVPNFSEGRDMRVMNQITDAIASVQGVKVLHVDPGEATNRTVVTFVGSPAAVVEALTSA